MRWLFSSTPLLLYLTKVCGKSQKPPILKNFQPGKNSSQSCKFFCLFSYLMNRGTVDASFCRNTHGDMREGKREGVFHAAITAEVLCTGDFSPGVACRAVWLDGTYDGHANFTISHGSTQQPRGCLVLSTSST